MICCQVTYRCVTQRERSHREGIRFIFIVKFATMADQFLCATCNIAIKKNEKSICCSLCDLWLHFKCTELSEILFNELNSHYKKNGFSFWPCKSCRVASQKLDAKIRQVDKKVDALSEKVQENTDNISEIAGKVATLENATPTVTPDIENGVFEEIRERELKRDNIVLHQVPEPEASVTAGKDRKEKDMNTLMDILKDVNVKVDPVKDIKFCHRAGEKPKDNSTVRPLIVGFKTTDKRNEVLTKSRNLKESANHSAVSIVPDLTKRQRKEEENLRAEAEKKNQEMDSTESLNYEWRLVGQKGQKRLIRAARKDNTQGHNAPPIQRHPRTRKRTIADTTEDEVECIDESQTSPGSQPRPRKQQK